MLCYELAREPPRFSSDDPYRVCQLENIVGGFVGVCVNKVETELASGRVVGPHDDDFSCHAAAAASNSHPQPPKRKNFLAEFINHYMTS